MEPNRNLNHATSWVESFGGLKTLSTELLDTLVSQSKVIALPAGTQVFGPGMSPANYLLLIQGTIRVQQVSEGGREIVLYRVSAGESCALTTACLMGYEDYLEPLETQENQGHLESKD